MVREQLKLHNFIEVNECRYRRGNWVVRLEDDKFELYSDNPDIDSRYWFGYIDQIEKYLNAIENTKKVTEDEFKTMLLKRYVNRLYSSLEEITYIVKDIQILNDLSNYEIVTPTYKGNNFEEFLDDITDYIRFVRHEVIDPLTIL